MEQAQEKDSKDVLLFLDASHFVMGCDFLGYIYGDARRMVKTWSGRKRYNVLGVMDYATKSMLTISNDEYITATQVCSALKKISEKYVDKNIHIILDNARYQKCKAVHAVAKEFDIHLEYLPPYSPNLNLIERVWKFVKGELRTKYYDDFKVFCEKIDFIVDGMANQYKEQMDSLLGKGVQLFDSLEPVAPNTYAPSHTETSVAA